MFFQLITHAVKLLLHKINSTVVKCRSGKILAVRLDFLAY